MWQRNQQILRYFLHMYRHRQIRFVKRFIMNCTAVQMLQSTSLKTWEQLSRIMNERFWYCSIVDVKLAYLPVSIHFCFISWMDRATIEWIKCLSDLSMSSWEIENRMTTYMQDRLQSIFSRIRNNVSTIIWHCQIHLYAVDVTICIEVDSANLNDAIERINEDSNSIGS